MDMILLKAFTATVAIMVISVLGAMALKGWDILYMIIEDYKDMMMVLVLIFVVMLIFELLSYK